MANFYGTARSNYFRVKDEAAFKAAMGQLPDIKVWDKVDGEGVKRHAIYSKDYDTGCWPTFQYIDGGEEDNEDIWMPEEIVPHLVDGEVCVLMEAGAEKLRYISGWAVAFDNTGKAVQVSLNDIYKKAKEAFGVMPTDAIY